MIPQTYTGDRPWPGYQPTLLSDDGGRYYGRKRVRPRLDLYDPAAKNCGPSEGSGACQGRYSDRIKAVVFAALR